MYECWPVIPLRHFCNPHYHKCSYQYIHLTQREVRVSDTCSELLTVKDSQPCQEDLHCHLSEGTAVLLEDHAQVNYSTKPTASVQE